ncbi:PEP-CTERM sorting domain-containing protein [uncultured Psychromonas sp.]|uniref:PEP-CTERM sorting domain-containing protein n=1 Tax=uncultured Psychromonas sp. TaxID=173974 RepID=UPI0026233169|nr:PEP-CTERM sorting domain-containing protein [uncultured Psychromonas sp.]
MKFKIILAGLILATYSLTNIANAHLIAFGWKDLGDGTISMYGQHWHSNQTTAYSDNGGVRIGVWDNTLSAASQNTASWQLFQWTNVINDMGGNTTQNDALVTAGILDGYAIDTNYWSNNSSQNDWFSTGPLVLGNGSWGLFTGTGCCVDTMSEAGLFDITGISSVPDGTGPGANIPEPSTMAIFALGLFCLISRKFKK